MTKLFSIQRSYHYLMGGNYNVTFWCERWLLQTIIRCLFYNQNQKFQKYHTVYLGNSIEKNGIESNWIGGKILAHLNFLKAFCLLFSIHKEKQVLLGGTETQWQKKWRKKKHCRKIFKKDEKPFNDNNHKVRSVSQDMCSTRVATSWCILPSYWLWMICELVM